MFCSLITVMNIELVSGSVAVYVLELALAVITVKVIYIICKLVPVNRAWVK